MNHTDGLAAHAVTALELAATGRTDSGIAQEMGLPLSQVRLLFREVYRYLGTDNRTVAIVKAMRGGWIN